MRTIRGNAGDGGKGAWSPMTKLRSAEMFYYAYPVRFFAGFAYRAEKPGPSVCQ